MKSLMLRDCLATVINKQSQTEIKVVDNSIGEFQPLVNQVAGEGAFHKSSSPVFLSASYRKGIPLGRRAATGNRLV